MLRINCQDSGNPYGKLIVQFLSTDFPANLDQTRVVFEAVSTHLFGTGNTRYGPMPTVESQVAIRAVLSKCIEAKRPIPILMPWGSKKGRNSTGIDIAEVGALKSLKCLNERIKRYYAPGLELVMRVEDTSGFYLWEEEDEKTFAASHAYIHDFQTLLSILDLPFIQPVQESVLMDPSKYHDEAEVIRPLMERYIADSDLYTEASTDTLTSFQPLRDLGWKGALSREQRDFYRTQYIKAFPGITLEAQNLKLARYMTSVLARVRLKGYGNKTAWGSDFIKLSFAPPVPGTPFSTTEKAVYLRTLPASMTRTHIPPWRAKGFLRLTGETMTPKLTSFGDTELLSHLQPLTVTYSRDHLSVDVRADFMPEDDAMPTDVLNRMGGGVPEWLLNVWS